MESYSTSTIVTQRTQIHLKSDSYDVVQWPPTPPKIHIWAPVSAFLTIVDNLLW